MNLEFSRDRQKSSPTNFWKAEPQRSVHRRSGKREAGKGGRRLGLRPGTLQVPKEAGQVKGLQAQSLKCGVLLDWPGKEKPCYSKHLRCWNNLNSTLSGPLPMYGSTSEVRCVPVCWCTHKAGVSLFSASSPSFFQDLLTYPSLLC